MKRLFRKRPASEPRRRRRLPRWRVRARSGRGESGDSSEKKVGRKQLDQVKKLATPPKPKHRLRDWSIRILVYGITLLSLFVGLSLFLVKTFVTPEMLQDLIVEQVETQTGGKLELGRVDFNVLSGVSLHDMVYYPPSVEDPRGFRNGGAILDLPLAEIEAIQVGYSLPMLAALRVHIDAVQIVKPAIHLRIDDGIANAAGIGAYRALAFPATEEPEVVDEEAAEAPTTLVPIDPSFLYMPVQIIAQSIGVRDLRFDLIETTAEQVDRVVVTNGLSFDTGLFWQGFESSVWLSMLSPFEQPLDVEIKEAVKNDAGQTIGLESQLSLKSVVSARVQVDDLTNLNVNVAASVQRVATPIAAYEDVGVRIQLDLGLNSDRNGLDIEQVRVRAADALELGLYGRVVVEDIAKQQLRLDIEQTLQVHLDEVTKLAAPFVPGFSSSGRINLEKLTLTGPLDLGALSEQGISAPLPYTAASIMLEEIAIAYPGLGLSVEPIDGNVTVASGPALNAEGTQVDVSLDLNAPKIEVSQRTDFGAARATIDQLAASVTSRVLLPVIEAPVVKINVEAVEVRSEGERIPSVAVPLFLEVDADGGADLKRLGADAMFELTDLMDISVDLKCQERCQKFRMSSGARMEKLDNLHSIILPFGTLLNLTDVMPTALSGGFDFQLSTRGTIPDPFVHADKILTDGDVKFNTQLNLSRLNLKAPIFNTQVEEFSTRLLARGSLQEQNIEITKQFEKVRVVLPPGMASADAQPIDLDRFQFDFAVQNELAGPLELPALPEEFETNVRTKLFLGKMTANGLLPRSLTDLQLDLEVDQDDLKEISLKTLDIKAPDLGTRVQLAATTGFDMEKMLPRDLVASLKTTIDHSGSEKLPGGIVTSGGVTIETKVKTPDLDDIDLSGEVRFDDFSLTVPPQVNSATGDPEGGLAVRQIAGALPIQQRVKISELLKKLESRKEKSTQQDKIASRSTDPLDDDEEVSTGADLGAVVQDYFNRNQDEILKNTSVVSLVDYTSVRPFYPEKNPLSIKRVEVANLELSNMEFDIELKQNWFALNQFMISFLGGKIQGDFQFAFDPMPRTFRTSLHMTRLDTRKLLKNLAKKFPNLEDKMAGGLLSNPYIDGTVHLAVNMIDGDMSGGIELTSIGKDQLRMILYFVDPFEENPTIGTIRRALGLGEVSHVSVPIKNGEIDIDVKVRTLAKIPLPVPKLTRFPIAQLVQNVVDLVLSGGEEEAEEGEAESAAPSAEENSDAKI